MRGLAYMLGIVSGLGLTVQVGMNSKLRTVLQSANTAALISFLVGTAALVALLHRHARAAAGARHAGRGAGLGLVRRVHGRVLCRHLDGGGRPAGHRQPAGTGAAGQLAMALVVDHFGWMGLPEHPITVTRLAGVALLGAGVWLITR